MAAEVVRLGGNRTDALFLRVLVQTVFVRRKVMDYKEHHFQYEADFPDLEASKDEDSSGRKQYRRGRPFRNARRRAKKPAAQPGPGIGGRRNRRWTW